MPHHLIRLRHCFQRLALVTWLTATLALPLLPLALRGGLLQPVTARRLAAIAAVLGKLRLQFSDLGAQPLDYLLLFSDDG